MRTRIRFLALGLAVAAAGCGEVSFFDVSVSTALAVDNTVITQCEVKVTGAASETFSLKNCDHVTSHTIGTFEYGTDSGSGTVNFDISARDGGRNVVAHNTISGNIAKGGHTPLMITLNPP